MAEGEAPYRRRVVAPLAALHGVEADTLTDDGGARAGVAPYREGHLEADGRRARIRLGALSGRSIVVVRWPVATHVEALHFGGGLGRGSRGFVWVAVAASYGGLSSPENQSGSLELIVDDWRVQSCGSGVGSDRPLDEVSGPSYR